ncbi:MAG: epoxyqueuosine reductase QueH [Candidatus Falkowbacteria bacterium]
MNYFLPALIAFSLSSVLTILIGKLALKWNIVDLPDNFRKIHTKPIPLLGGLAIFLSFSIVSFGVFGQLTAGNLQYHHWLGVFLGGLILMIGGFGDDKFNFKPSYQIVFPILAALCVILGGVEIEKVTSPGGGFVYIPALISALLIGIWLLGMMYTTKLLDGVDGLVSGVSAIGSLVIFLFTVTTRYYQPDIALAAIILAGSILGFWVFNFNPAKIFLGEGGSLFLGYILGVLAIISGGKIAIALLIMGVPILDVLWTIIRRTITGKNPFKFADRKHLHHRLLDFGLNQKQTVLVFYILSATFGLSGLFLQSKGKILILLLLFISMVFLVIGFSFLDRKKRKPRLLVHTCCAPCVAYIASQVLVKDYDITLFFYNPNIDKEEEWEKRLEAVKAFSKKYNLPLIIEPYKHGPWLEKVAGYEIDPEGGSRCTVCFRERLEKSAIMAKSKKFDYFTTSLTASPYKDSQVIMSLGEEIGEKAGIEFLSKDFKDDDGTKKSMGIIRDMGLYRQKYCGCEFAKRG